MSRVVDILYELWDTDPHKVSTDKALPPALAELKALMERCVPKEIPIDDKHETSIVEGEKGLTIDPDKGELPLLAKYAEDMGRNAAREETLANIKRMFK